MSVTAGVSDATIVAIREKLRGKIGQTKVKRYWPGKAPEWADEPEEDADLRTSSSSYRNRNSIDSAFPSENNSINNNSTNDPRLRRLAENRAIDRDEVRADHRRIRQAEIISTELEQKEEDDVAAAAEEDEDDVEERRRRIRERLLLRRREEEKELPKIDEDDDVYGGDDDVEDEESESEYETDSEDDDEASRRRAMMKPVFVPKNERETIAERERIEAEEIALEEAVKRRISERKIETKKIVVEKIREDLEIQKSMTENAEADVGDIDTDDELNEAEEYETWKSREIARIKRDRDDRETMLKEREEIERVRNMTEEERREWERKNPKTTKEESGNKQKWRFMQKYYHKGAFFQDDADDSAGTMGSDDIYRRDFSAPTGEDKLNKTILPKVMQVKHFGRSGRTKWTHLVNEDTTDWTTPWANNDLLRSKYNAKMAGMNKPVAKPKGSRKLKDWEER